MEVSSLYIGKGALQSTPCPMWTQRAIHSMSNVDPTRNPLHVQCGPNVQSTQSYAESFTRPQSARGSNSTWRSQVARHHDVFGSVAWPAQVVLHPDYASLRAHPYSVPSQLCQVTLNMHCLRLDNYTVLYLVI
jgi:hypothetical protein